MNKNRLMLPIGALFMVPLFVGCNTDSKYEPSFNNDQIICTHGDQIVDITLDKYSKNKLQFKDTLQPEWFTFIDEKYQSKAIKYVLSYNNGDSAFLLLEGDIENFTQDSTTVEIKVSKDAFIKNALDGKITVTLYANQIRYGSYTDEIWGVDDDGKHFYTYNAQIELVGSMFFSKLLENEISIEAGKGKVDGDTLIEIYKGDQILAESGKIELYDMDNDKYFMHLHMDDGVLQEDDISIKFCKNSTILKEYTCTFTPEGHGKPGPFIFIK